MKKAFTLAEIIVGLAIVGVLSALLVPVLFDLKPDKERTLYKKSMASIQMTMSYITNKKGSGEFFGDGQYWASVSAANFCEDVADAMNVAGTPNCSSAGSASIPNFVTLEGTKWWGFGGSAFTTTGTGSSKIIWVDVDGKGGKNTVGIDQLRILVKYDGQVSIDDSWTPEKDYIEDIVKMSK